MGGRFSCATRVRATQLWGGATLLSLRCETGKRLRCRAIWLFPVFPYHICETGLPLLCEVSAITSLMRSLVRRVIGIEILPLLMAVSRCFDWT